MNKATVPNTYIASDFRAQRILARDLQPDDEVMSDDLTVVKIVRRRRAAQPKGGGKVIAFIGTELRIVGDVSSVVTTILEYGINKSVLLLSRRPEPQYVYEIV